MVKSLHHLDMVLDGLSMLFFTPQGGLSEETLSTEVWVMSMGVHLAKWEERSLVKCEVCAKQGHMLIEM